MTRSGYCQARLLPIYVLHLVVANVGGLTTETSLKNPGKLSNYAGPSLSLRLRSGLTSKEYSSGSTRHLGRISKYGDRYLRMLLTHGARAVLRAAGVSVQAGKTVDDLRHWALAVQRRSNHNKAVCALANKLARICYATLRDGEPYGAVHLNKKVARTAFALPA